MRDYYDVMVSEVILMTRQRAIEVLKAWDLNWSDNFTANEFEQAFAMAISALKESKGELVSRQAVLEQIYQWAIGNREYLPINAMHYLTRRMQDLPSVTPQQKIGHWIRGHHGFGCSNCHKSIEGKWDDNIDDITGTLFCPNCGAKMERGDKE